MKDNPLVTVICLCHNHGRFVREAIESVVHQTYSNIQIIIVDDASRDTSVREITRLLNEYTQLSFIRLEENIGNTKAFNKALSEAEGDFIVDFSTDDVMVPERIEKQMELFSSLDNTYGVVFTDALMINEEGETIGTHYDDLFRKGHISEIPQGDVYADLLRTYFIASPTMLVRRAVFDRLNGYDEHLAYEDFDFWVRSSRYFNYGFLNEKLTKIRRVSGSLSSHAYKRGDRQLHSTYLVCRKALALNRLPREDAALVQRIRYELRQSVFSENHSEAVLFYRFLAELRKPGMVDRLLIFMNTLRLPLRFIRNAYLRLRFGQ